jgi:AcrR family transcriptional regulator
MLTPAPDTPAGRTGSDDVRPRGVLPDSAAAGRSGRRPGASGTRAAILAAARRQFAEVGYDRTSLRSVAAAAEVDQKLVTYFFGSKQQLFVVAVEVPYGSKETIRRALAGDPQTLGERIARYMISMIETPAVRDSIVGLVRAATSEPQAARMVRELRERIIRVFGPTIAELLGPEEAEARFSMIASQFFGLVMARYIIGAEPLASMPPDELVAFLAPVLQHYAKGPLART